MNVYQRLNAARAQFHTLKLQKTGHNKFAGYNYFELGDFLIPALQVFKDHGLCAIVSFDKDTASMEIRAEEDPSACIKITSPMGSAALKGCHEVQNIGAVETYQRRYLWVAALEIVEHDAIDASAGADKGKGAPQIGVRDGIGDDLPQDWKDYLQDLAQRVKEMVGANSVSAANEAIRKDNLDDAQATYLHNLLDSKTRAALKRKEPA